MVPLKRDWTPFKDHQDALDHYRRWGLISSGATELRTVMVVDGYFGSPQPCRIVGYETEFENWVVIELNGQYSGIHCDYLVDMQPIAHQPLPRGVVFADILSHYVVMDVTATSPCTVSATVFSYGQPEVSFSSTTDIPSFPADLRNFLGVMPVFRYESNSNLCKELLDRVY